MTMGLKVNGGLKSNLMQISQQIQQEEIMKNGPYRIFDMLRAEIIVQNSSQIIEVLTMIEENKDLDIIRIQNQLKEQEQKVVINVIYIKSIIAEIVIKYGEKLVINNNSNFLYELTRAQTVPKFRQLVLAYINNLAENQFIKQF